MSQLGAGYTHYRRGNLHGTHVLLRRALSRITGYGPGHQGVDVDGLAADIAAHAEAVEEAEGAGKKMPEIDPPKIPRVSG
jgi:predicted metal-dependent hydrolase